MKENLLDKVKKIFKRIIAIGGATLTLMLPTSCASEQQATNEDKEDNRTSFIDSLREDVPTTQSELDKIVIEETTEITYTTTETTTNKETTTKPSNQVSNQQVDLYNKLLNKFNIEFNKKGFSDISYKYLKAVFDETYKNYDEWQQTSKDLPSKEQYITNNVINNIKNIKNINFYSINSKEAQESLNKGRGLAYTNNRFEITMIYDDSNEQNFYNEVERLSHELIHVDQKNIVFNNEYFKDNAYLKNIIIEGEATSKMKYMKELKTEKLSSDFIRLGDYTLEYKSDNGEGYPREMNLYNNIMFLVGYDVMEKISSGEQGLDTIKDAIEQNYGKQTSNKIFSELENLYNAYENGNNKAEMNAATNLQKEFLKCIEKDIERLKTKKEVIQYCNIYRAYKINNLSKVYKDGVDVTNEYFDIEKIDEKLTDKVIETKAFNFTENGKQNREAIKCLLYTTTEEINDEGIYIPANLQEVDYKYKDGKLILGYENRTEYNPANKYVDVTMQLINGKVVINETERNALRNDDTGAR